MLTDSFIELITKGGYTVALLIACSVISLAVALEKYVQFSALKENSIETVKNKILDALKVSAGDAEREADTAFIISLKIRTMSPVAGIFRAVLNNRSRPKDEIFDAVSLKIDKELIAFEKHLGVLSTLGAISPFIGLFGTVIGIIRSFQALSLNEMSGYGHVMAGIAEALVATAAGLIVAVPSVVFYNYFMRRIKRSIIYLEEAADEFIRACQSRQAD